MAARSGLAPTGWLAAWHSSPSGQVGFDVTEVPTFCPAVRPDALTAMHPRLSGARTLIDAARSPTRRALRVASEAQTATRVEPRRPNCWRYSCTCPWWMKHKGRARSLQSVLAVCLVLKEES